MDLSRVKDRDVLKPTREPHWQRIRPGCFLGFRPSRRGGAGTWVARAYDEQAQKYRFRAMGHFSDVSPKDRFARAKTEAEAFCRSVESGGCDVAIETVEQACRHYAQSRGEAEQRFKRHVYDDPVAGIRLDKLRRHHLVAWRERLRMRPASVARHRDGSTLTRARKLASVNRDMTALRAALNCFLAPGTPGTDAAWQEALRAFRNVGGQRTLYLDPDQRRLLLNHAAAEAVAFIRALCLLPLRPGAVAALKVRDFDPRTSELTIGKDKNGEPRRIVLPEDAGGLFSGAAAERSVDEPLFVRANGSAWDRNSWKVPIAEAAKLAGLPAGTTAYTMRHSAITDLVMNGVPLFAVAKISGTSVEMIEQHYGHLVPSAGVEALRHLEL